MSDFVDAVMVAVRRAGGRVLTPRQVRAVYVADATREAIGVLSLGSTIVVHSTVDLAGDEHLDTIVLAGRAYEQDRMLRALMAQAAPPTIDIPVEANAVRIAVVLPEGSFLTSLVSSAS